jgi:antirestriction protein ArdC
MTSNAVFDVINDRILAKLDEGVVPWRKPWNGPASAPRSVDGRTYSGINAFFLACLGYADPRFLTFKKALELGGRVRRGEKGYPVVFWKQLSVTQTDEETGEERTKRIPMLRYFTVFNVAQCDGINVPALPPVAVGANPIEAAEAIVANMPNPPAIGWDGGNRAYYSPAMDAVSLPERTQFTSDHGYYETAFHELGHSTGHPSRLNREGIERFDHFGSERYAREELVAEFTAAFLMGEAGIEAQAIDNLAAYIASWKQRITEDPRCLVVAAGKAQKAADYILGRFVAEEAAAA